MRRFVMSTATLIVAILFFVCDDGYRSIRAINL
jgi:hypothetical protein